ncbi:histidine kinase [Jatrophihabitans sp. GAS493]|uniref:GAF domain-containing sensor histidine kinase n=1 Tax=Jatrophihabitans sp. GAS493 TaxID=1907575 RepID=UPI000BB8A083|nr:GAF domain-containing protein [Jatrophihabitans sp. GAS493]SOD70887.1 histidine kinase [Jatrophihabitans sp. GAS493]
MKPDVSDPAGIAAMPRSADPPIGVWPDDPVARESDRLLSQLQVGVAAGLAANQRLAELLRSNQLIIGDLLMPIVLRRIAEAACEVSGADGCVLVRRSPFGDVAEAVGFNVDSAELASVKALATSTTAPGGYSSTPVMSGERLFGTIYLSLPAPRLLGERENELIEALARTAAVAIDNAELFDESRHRQHWLQASTEIFRQLLSGSTDEHLALITSRARDIADADAGMLAVGRADGNSLEVRVSAGRAAEGLVGWVFPIDGSLSGRVVKSGEPILLDDFAVVDHLRVPVRDDQLLPVGPTLVLPLSGSGQVRGILSLVRARDRPPFTPVDLELAAAFASQAALALDLAEARLHQQRMMLLEDRDRIARDLHDHVIQRLFATGLSLESIARSLGAGEVGERLIGEVGEIDAIIRELRSSILRLRGSLAVGEDALSSRLKQIVDGATDLLGFTPSLRINGTMGKQLGDQLLEDIATVLHEAFADVVRRGGVTEVNVAVTLTPGLVTVTVHDNGDIEARSPIRAGLTKVRALALSRSGAFDFAVGADLPSEGRILTWTVPIDPR